MRAESSRKQFNTLLVSVGLFLILVGIMVLIILWLVSLPKESDFHFDLGQGRSLDIYCEGEFFYEPPGYVSFQITENGSIVVPERDFSGIGSQRVPSGRLEVLSTRDGETIAFRRNFNVMIMHDFKTNRTWPDENGKVKWDEYLLAIELLQRFKAEGQDLYSDLIDHFLNIDLSSPDKKLVVNQIWNAQGDQAELRVRVYDYEKRESQLLLPQETITVPLSQDFDWRSGWGAGWISKNRFGVWVTGAGVRVWEFSDEGVGKELPSPLDVELVEEVKSFPAPVLESKSFTL